MHILLNIWQNIKYMDVFKTQHKKKTRKYNKMGGKPKYTPTQRKYKKYKII